PLPLRPPDGLSQRRGRNGNLRAGLTRAGQEHHHAAIIAVQGDQSPGVQGHAWHQAAGCVPVPRTSSAQARSLSESSPPVARSASASMAPHPATSSRATATACCTNPDTLAAAPACTSARIWSSCTSSRVIVTFLVAIPITIPSVGRLPCPLSRRQHRENRIAACDGRQACANGRHYRFVGLPEFAADAARGQVTYSSQPPYLLVGREVHSNRGVPREHSPQPSARAIPAEAAGFRARGCPIDSGFGRRSPWRGARAPALPSPQEP